MFKRIGVWGSPFYLVIFWLSVVASAGAVCGANPPLPPDGFMWPATGAITEPWSLDCRTDRGHRGIDIATDAGTSIKAAAAGTIGFVGYTPAESGGTTITINHEGGLRTTYLHVTDPRVLSGETVSKGQLIATANGSPLHFGVKLVSGNRESYFNPVQMLPLITLDSGTVIETPAPEPDPEPAPLPDPSTTPTAADPAPVQPVRPSPVESPGVASLPISPAATEQPEPEIQVQPLPEVTAFESREYPVSTTSARTCLDTSAIKADQGSLSKIPDTALTFLEPADTYTPAAGRVTAAYFGMVKTRLAAPHGADQKQNRLIDNAWPGQRLAVAAAVLLLSAVAAIGGRIAGTDESEPCFGLWKSS